MQVSENQYELNYLRLKFKALETKHKFLSEKTQKQRDLIRRMIKEISYLRKSVKHEEFHHTTFNDDLALNIRKYLEMELNIDLSLKTRIQKYIKGRCMFYYFTRKYTDLSLKQIAGYVGNLDHSTVIHGLTIFEDYLTQDKVFAKDLKKFEDYLINNFIESKDIIIENIKAEIETLSKKLETFQSTINPIYNEN